MMTIRRLPATMAVALAAVALFLCGGCSCEDSEEPAAEVIVVQPKEKRPAPAQQPQPGGQGGGRRAGTGFFEAPGVYLKTTVRAIPYAERKVGTASAQYEVKQFYAIEGRYPHSLKELEQWRGEPLPAVRRGHTYKYDKATGKVEVVPVE